MSIFMKIPDVPGDVAAAGYEGTIRLLDLSWGLSRPGTPTAKPSFTDISVTKGLDRATPVLARRAASGKSLGKCRIFNVATGDGLQEFEKITTWKTRVTSLYESDNESAGPPLDAVSFSFDKIELIYRVYDNQGQPAGTIRFAWDLINDEPF